ncbi:MAG: hypothetical protein PHQ23_17755, partial [Candidatus Wallbacteria bacterium]|nr:hypothetical protein [Candidatus Wallbacteria bacterium]
MRIERKADSFKLYSDDVRSAAQTSMDRTEAGALLNMLLRARDKFDHFSPDQKEKVRIPGIMLDEDKEFKGKITLRPSGIIRLNWDLFDDELNPDSLWEQLAHFSGLYYA